MRAVSILAVLLLAATALGQLSPEEAQAKLKEKAEQRKAERAKLIQVSEGQLEDMQAEIAHLRAVIVDLQKKLQPQPAQAAAKPHKNYNDLEIGMTKDDVLEFVRRHSQTYKVTEITAQKQGGATMVQTTRVSRTGAQRVRLNPADPLAGGAGQQPIDGQQAVAADAVIRETPESKTETMVLTSFRAEQREDGGHRDVLGHYQTDYSTVYIPSGHIRITLVDDVVIGIEAR